MNPSSIDYPTIIQTVAAALAIIATTVGAIFGVINAIKRRKFKAVSYYVSKGVFADRTGSLHTLISTLKSNTRVVNVYGKRGIGKSAFLCFFCDYANHKLNRENSKRRKIAKELPKIRGRAVYVHVSGDGGQPLDKQILLQVARHCITLSDAAEWIAQVVKHKKIFLVIDNINNAGLSKEVEAVIDIFLSHSDRYRIIVGSIEKQPFLNIFNEKHIQYIELSAFDEKDVFDFADKNSKSLSPEDLSKIIDFTEGLPVFVSLLLSNDFPVISYNKDRMNNYLSRIIEDLEPQVKTIAQYIGFLSITKPIFPVRILKDLGIPPSSACLEKLENCSLIEFDEEAQTVKMHELFRDYICQQFSAETEIIRKIYEYYRNEDYLYEQTYYLIMLDGIAHNYTINQAIQKAIDEENFAFLLTLGEHYKRLYGLRQPTISLSEETFLTIIYGYLEGLIGVGSYPSAQEVIDKCKISARSPKNDLQFRFSILTAHLYHLQNKYNESIATYQALLNLQQDTGFEKYRAKCLWGIAHALRHQGRDFDAAVQFYDESIAAAETMGAHSQEIKSMREKLVIFLLRGQREAACDLHHQICLRVNQLPPTGYKETRISFLKSEANYIATTRKKNPQLEKRLLEKVLSVYRAQRKRLQYNMYFQLGEYFRRQEDYVNAKDNYNKALAFSKQNLDHNLETLSTIAIIICDICHDSLTDSSERTLIDCLEICEEFDLYVNELLTDVMLAYVRNENVDGQTIQELEAIQYKKAVHASNHRSKANLCSLDLFLM